MTENASASLERSTSTEHISPRLAKTSGSSPRERSERDDDDSTTTSIGSPSVSGSNSKPDECEDELGSVDESSSLSIHGPSIDDRKHKRKFERVSEVNHHSLETGGAPDISSTAGKHGKHANDSSVKSVDSSGKEGGLGFLGR